MNRPLRQFSSVRMIINDIHELGFAPAGFADRFMELVARLPDTAENHRALHAIDFSPFYFDPEFVNAYDDEGWAEQSTSDEEERYWSHWENWYGYRFDRLILPGERVFVRAEVAKMFWLLAEIFALAFPEKAALWVKKGKHEAASREANHRKNVQRYLQAHGRTPRAGRTKRIRCRLCQRPAVSDAIRLCPSCHTSQRG